MPEIDITQKTGCHNMPEIKTKSEKLDIPKINDSKSIHHIGDSVKFTKIITEEKIETEDEIEIEKITEIFEEEVPAEATIKESQNKIDPHDDSDINKEERFDIEISEQNHEEKMQKKEKKKLSKKMKVISKIFFAIYIIVIAFFLIKIISAGALSALPTKFLLPMIAGISILTLIFAVFTFLSKFKKVAKIITIFFEILFSATFVYASFALDAVFDFFNNIQAENYQLESFYVLVKTDSDVKSVDEISDKTIAIYEDTSDTYQEALSILSEHTTAAQISYKDFIDAGTALNENSNEAMFIKGSMKEVAEEIIPDFSTRIIDTIEVKTFLEQSEVKEIDISNEPFSIFISGIDTYGEVSTVSRSDVNMIATVNPKTNEILLTSIPRDYYVQLHGTTGLKDKLTHAGIYGVDMSRQTIEDLLDIKIDYYAKVNFSSLINIVDTIGGITINSDMPLTLTSSGKTCYYQSGENNVDGFCALRFARERYSYAEGDRHRVQNQQEVLSAIIRKVTTSKSIILNYSELLSSISGSFQTNIPTSQIYKLVNLQLDTMPSWNITTTQLDGSGASDYTYSIPSQVLYVMVPNQETIDAAKLQIDKTMYPEQYIEQTEEEIETEEISE